MTRVTVDTGKNSISLQLEYGSLVDAKTNGSITASTTKVKFATLDAYIRAGSYAFWSGTNQLAASGGWAIDKSWSNIAIGSSSSPLKNAAKKLATVGKQERDVVFGKTNGTYNVTLKMTGVLSAGTMEGSYSRTVPRRPYHAPYDPVVELSDDFISISGNQTSSSSDRYWDSLLWALATDDVWSTDAKTAGSTTSIPFAPSTNGKYQARAKAENTDGTSWRPQPGRGRALGLDGGRPRTHRSRRAGRRYGRRRVHRDHDRRTPGGLDRRAGRPARCARATPRP